MENTKHIRAGLAVLVFAFGYMLPATARSQERQNSQLEKVFDFFDFNHDKSLSVKEIAGPCYEFDLVVGARGNSLQLVLNSIYGVGGPIGTIPWTVYSDLISVEGETDGEEDRLSDSVEFAIPLCFGGFYKHFLAVGTTSEMFDKALYMNNANGEKTSITFANGRSFDANDYLAAVVGADVAFEKQIEVGDEIFLNHGSSEMPSSHVYEKSVRVTGILSESHTAADRQVFVNIEFFFLEDDQRRAPSDESSDENKGGWKLMSAEHRVLSAILVKCKSSDEGVKLDRSVLQERLNQNTCVQAVNPVQRVRSAMETLSAESALFMLGRGLDETEGQISRSEFLEFIKGK